MERFPLSQQDSGVRALPSPSPSSLPVPPSVAGGEVDGRAPPLLHTELQELLDYQQKLQQHQFRAAPAPGYPERNNAAQPSRAYAQVTSLDQQLQRYSPPRNISSPSYSELQVQAQPLHVHQNPLQ